MAEPDTKKTENETKKAEPVKDAKGRITNTKLTKADVAKLVRRTVAKVENGKVVLDKDKRPVVVPQAIREDEVLSFAEYDDRVVVVTTSGEKLTAKK